MHRALRFGLVAGLIAVSTVGMLVVPSRAKKAYPVRKNPLMSFAPLVLLPLGMMLGSAFRFDRASRRAKA